jgi:CRP/FNR family cyclic AMP-dependent transcriptional regulator
VIEALRHRPELAFDFIDLLCARLRALSRKHEERSFLPVPERLASRLLYLDGKLGGPDGEVAVSQADLADFVGATREAVAKTLAVWRARDWVGLSRGAIRILDRAELEAVAAGLRE